MDEEFLKRHTDCVYFLASPLTCKKGFECEYRHSEIARLNPRECWYWLSGSCFNPSCPFRHPPLDALTEEALEPAPSSVPMGKTNVPCYYYFNGYCNKGGTCLFRHDTETESVKPVKVQPSANHEAVHFVNNTFAGSDLGSAPTIARKVEAEKRVQLREGFKIPAFAAVRHQSGSSQISLSKSEEIASFRPYSLPPASGFVRGIYSGESHGSDDLEEFDEGDVNLDEIEPEERLESSPGFDVLVDGEEENLDSEGAQLYITDVDGRREMDSHFSGYDFENPFEYNLNYPQMECRFASERLHRYNPNVNENIFGQMQNGPRVKTTPMGVVFDYHKGSDLRDQLRRRRSLDGRLFPRLSRIQESSWMIRRTRELPWRRSRRLASEVLRHNIGFPRHAKPRRPKKQHKEEKKRAKRQRLASEVSREEPAHEYGEFSGPKSLSQIKDEKRKLQDNGRSIDFEGPKALNEILRDKGKSL